MKNRLFNKEISHACKHCLFSMPLESETEVLCRKRGVVDRNDCCRKYKYDVMKRMPERPIIPADYNEDDFLL